LVLHTTSVLGTRFEVDIPTPFLKPGSFDAQQIVTVAQARLIKRLGDPNRSEMNLVQDTVRLWLAL
jgi:mRNA interferase MazF